jgi:branched-chain amino acid transport system substrate-binding protein
MIRNKKGFKLLSGAAVLVLGASSLIATTASASGGGASAPGVTAHSIKIAMMYSNSGPAAGVLTGIDQGVTAYVDYVNSQGGINGRKVSLGVFDDGFSTVTAQTECASFIPKYFMIAGGNALGDAGCYAEIKSSGIPYVQSPVDQQIETLPNFVFAGIGPVGYTTTTEDVLLRQAFPNVTKVAEFYENEPGNSVVDADEVAAEKAAGFDVVLDEPIDPTSANFTNYVIQAQAAGAQAVLYDDSGLGTESALAIAMAEQNYHPAFVESISTYDSTWHKLAGAGAAGWTEELTYQPFLNPAYVNASPGGKLFVKWMDKEHSPLSYLAADGWVGMETALDGVKAAGKNPTRKSVVADIKKLGTFTADGFLTPTKIGSFSECGILMQSTATGYKELLPKKPGSFACTTAPVIPDPGTSTTTTAAG